LEDKKYIRISECSLATLLRNRVEFLSFARSSTEGGTDMTCSESGPKLVAVMQAKNEKEAEIKEKEEELFAR